MGDYMKLNQDNFDFFNDIGGSLDLRTSKGKIKKCSLEGELFNPENETFRELTAEEKQLIVMEGPSIVLHSLGGSTEHQAPNGQWFTVANLLSAIESTEKQTRANTDWFDYIDCHHIFLEGIHPLKEKENEFEISWGS